MFEDALKSLHEVAVQTSSESHIGAHEENLNFDTVFHSWDVHRRLQYVGHRLDHELDANVTSLLFRDAHHLEHMMRILDVMKGSITSLHGRFRLRLEPISSKLSKGIAMVPDEVLGLIFEIAAPPGDGSKKAVWLSHVSRRFRGVALGMQHLWTTLRSDGTKDELGTLIARSGIQTDLHIVIHKEVSSMDIYEFLDACLPMASRWSTLKIFPGMDQVSEFTTVDDTMEIIFDRCMRHVDLPRLKHLRIQQNQSSSSGLVTLAAKQFVPSWATPNLRVIESDNYIPAPSPSYRTVRSFTMSFSMADEQYVTQLGDLLMFLASATAVTALGLTFEMCDNSLQGWELTRTLCPSVTSLTLSFSSFEIGSDADMTDILRKLTPSLHMPNLITLSVSVEIWYDDLLDLPEESPALLGIVCALLPYHGSHSNLASLSIELMHTMSTDDLEDDVTRDEEDEEARNQIFSRILFIPLDKIPQVSTLSVKTFTRLCFDNFYYTWCAHSGGTPNALSELHLLQCKQLGVENLQETVESLKDCNVWETLDRVYVEDCNDSLSYSGAMEVVGPEKLRFRNGWPEDGLLS